MAKQNNKRIDSVAMRFGATYVIELNGQKDLWLARLQDFDGRMLKISSPIRISMQVLDKDKFLVKSHGSEAHYLNVSVLVPLSQIRTMAVWEKLDAFYIQMLKEVIRGGSGLQFTLINNITF